MWREADKGLFKLSSKELSHFKCQNLSNAPKHVLNHARRLLANAANASQIRLDIRFHNRLVHLKVAGNLDDCMVKPEISSCIKKKLNVQFSFWQVWEIVSRIQDLDMTHVPSLCQEASLEAAPSSCPWQDILQQFHGFQLSCKQSIHRSRLDRKAHRSAKSKVGSETWTKTNQKSPETKF